MRCSGQDSSMSPHYVGDPGTWTVPLLDTKVVNATHNIADVNSVGFSECFNLGFESLYSTPDFAT